MNNELRGFQAFKMYQAMMLHFNEKSDYDYFKYNGATRSKPETFAKDKNKQIRFVSIEKRVGMENLELFFFANLCDNPFKKFVPHSWIKVYKQELQRIENFKETFKANCQGILDNSIPIVYLFESGYENNLYPMLFSLYERGTIDEMTMIYFHLYIEPFLIEGKSSDQLRWTGVIDNYARKIPFYRRCYFSRLDNREELTQYALHTLSKCTKP